MLGSFRQDQTPESSPEELVVSGAKARYGSEVLVQVVGQLPRDDQRAIALRFALNSGKSRTLDQVGKELGVTREGARRIVLRAQESASGKYSGTEWSK